ncbi:MAG: hypothetical protein HC837_05120 [Chloroflexaceae bacterium]|nr:hypothetical protein [Chloroflexaceae bacterium]
MMSMEQMFPTAIDRTEPALVLVGVRRQVIAMSKPAAQLLNVSTTAVRGQHVNVVAKGILTSLLHGTGVHESFCMLKPDSGMMLIATTRTLLKDNERQAGWLITLHLGLHEALQVLQGNNGHTSSQKGAEFVDLQHKVQNMHDLVEMLPQFSRYQYWQSLLIEHMQKLMGEIDYSIIQLEILFAGFTHEP